MYHKENYFATTFLGGKNMPSNLPVIKTNTKQENIDKMKIIAQKNKRSMAKELELLIEIHIKEYESLHGEIKTE